MAWDNYDENSETLSGSGTLHDTVGICYQNLTPQNTEQNINLAREDSSDFGEAGPAAKRPRKRSFEKQDIQLEPYRKKPKFSTFHYEKKTCEVPSNLKQAENRDMLWMMTNVFHDNAPVWVGWNS